MCTASEGGPDFVQPRQRGTDYSCDVRMSAGACRGSCTEPASCTGVLGGGQQCAHHREDPGAAPVEGPPAGPLRHCRGVHGFQGAVLAKQRPCDGWVFIVGLAPLPLPLHGLGVAGW